MRYYLSGVTGTREAGLLLDAGIPYVLVDPAQAERVGVDMLKQFKGVAMDNGSYAAWKEGRDPGTADIDRIKRLLNAWDGWDWHASPDIIPIPRDGEEPPQPETTARRTWEIWTSFKASGALPVWHWGEPQSYLGTYLSENRVGIGGVVNIMRGGHRQKDKTLKKELNKRRELFVEELKGTLTAYKTAGNGHQVHLFAANNLEAAEALKPHVTSMDSSKWWDAARYGYVFFLKDTKLRYAPSGALGKPMSRDARIRTSLLAWKEWVELNDQAADEPALHKPIRAPPQDRKTDRR